MDITQGHPTDDDVPQPFSGTHAAPAGDRKTGHSDGERKAAAVVQDAEAYQRLLDLAAQAEAAEGIRQGQEDIAGGRTRPTSAVFDQVRSGYGIPG